MQKYKLRKGEKMTMHTFNILEALEASACAWKAEDRQNFMKFYP